MNINIELDEHDLKRLVVAELERRLGDVEFSTIEVTIETKSKQNFKSEWETAAFRVRVVKAIS